MVEAIETLLGRTTNACAYLQISAAPYVIVSESGYDWYPERSSTLHIAADIGNSRVIERFLKKKGDKLVSAMNSLGQTPLHIASKAGYTAICLLLIKNGASFLQHDNYGYTPLSWAIWNGHCDTASAFLELKEEGKLLQFRSKTGETLLHLAVQRGHVEVTSLLLQKSIRRQCKK